MKKRQAFFPKIKVALLLLFFAHGARAQDFSVDQMIARGDSLHSQYRFDEAGLVYSRALESVGADSLSYSDSILKVQINNKLLLSENGNNMTGFVYSPVVVARHMFSLEDFFLYYPLKDRSWRRTPNQLDSLSGNYAKAIYAPSDDKVIYYSASDKDGIRNIYKTALNDSVWTVPVLLNEHTTSASNEIYPMLSDDGKTMYFASERLFGVGGYDIYVSEWSEEAGDWSDPVNMGFPYSSPANDFLMVNSQDGKYTLFASDRGCPKDSVWVYVLEYDSMPVRSRVDDPQQLAEIALLKPSARHTGGASEVKSEIPENVDTRRYMDRMAQVRALRDSIALCESELSDLRDKYSLTENEAEKRRLESSILKDEAMIPVFQARLDEAVRQLQEVEMEFLFSGVVIDPDKLLADADREIVSETPDYIFSKMEMGEPLTLEMEKPKPSFDYSFKILEKSQFAEDMTIPPGIAYQIQIFSTAAPSSLVHMKGLSPVFESKSPTGRYIYRVGLFKTYSDVLTHLNRVKSRGFKGAYIVGYVDGKEMPVKKVREIEAERSKAVSVLYRVEITPSGDELDAVAVSGIRQQASGKDVARIDGGLVVGPFNDKTDALALVEFIEVMGYGKARLETIQNN